MLEHGQNARADGERLHHVARQRVLAFEPGPVEVAQYIRDEVRGGVKATNLVLSMIKDKEGFDQAMLTSRRESVATARDTATTASASSLAAPAGAPAAVAPRSSPLSPRGNTA